MSIFNMFKRKQKPLKEKPVPVAMNTAFGQFVIADPKKEMCYEGKINWGGEEVTVSLYCDSDKVFTANNALKHLYNIMKNREEWDRLLKQAIVDDLGDSNGMVKSGETVLQKKCLHPLQQRNFAGESHLDLCAFIPRAIFTLIMTLTRCSPTTVTVYQQMLLVRLKLTDCKGKAFSE